MANLEEAEQFLKNIQWLGHSGFLIKSDINIVIDAFKTDLKEKADIVLITHEHFDHCSVDDVEKIVTPETVIVASPDCQSKLARVKVKEVLPITPDKGVVVKGVKIKAVPAYNINKRFHPRENDWVGFLITLNNVTIYHAGDTDLIPEMKQLQGIVDIALLPVSGTYVMTADEAVEAVKIIKPRIAIPMHYGSIVGSRENAERFKELAENQGFNVKLF